MPSKKNAIAPAHSLPSSFDENSIINDSSLSDIDDDQDSAIRSNNRLVSTNKQNQTKSSSKQSIASGKQSNVPIHHRLASKTRSSQKQPSTVSDDDDDDRRSNSPPRIRQEEKNKTDFLNYALDDLGLDNHFVQEIDIEEPPVKPKPIWKTLVGTPRWLLLLASNFVILLLIATFCVVFIFQNVRVSYGGSCLTNSDCNSYIGLSCTAGTCSCNYVQFWDGKQCKAQRTFNRSCISQNQCNSVAELLCLNVTINSVTDTRCWCSNYRYWTGNRCTDLKSFNRTCSSNGECDINNGLICLSSFCNCNSTQFWNNAYCENKHIYGQQCFSTYWCNTLTSGLVCSTWSPTAGTCDCYSNQYWWSINQTCLPQLPFNATCSFDYQCITNLSLVCLNGTSSSSCQCPSEYWYNASNCVSKLSNGANCTNSLQCDNTVFLSCDLTSQTCTCNVSDFIWDGAECVLRRGIGGACTNSNQCLARQNLICATSGVWNGTCACPTNYYWNPTTLNCTLKKLWNVTCITSYECYDGGYLSCQPSAALNTTVCDCAYTNYWTGFLNNTYSGYCTPKIGYGITSFNCTSTYQCQDYNYVTCIGGICTCSIYQYWDGTLCEPRLNYSYPCNSTGMCRNWAGGPNLQCLIPPSGGSIKQCLCTPTQYFDYCADSCFTAAGYLQACNSSTCYATSMCDASKGLSCLSNQCNCTSTQWWNSTYCVAKGTNLDPCTTGQDYQCQQYNLLTCIAGQCQCGSNFYWSSSSNYCLSKKSINGTCTSTSQCLTAAGVGLSCISGMCQCSSGYYWNTGPQQCDTIPG